MATEMQASLKPGFEEVLKQGKFAVTCEVGPPKGAETGEIKESLTYLKSL